MRSIVLVVVATLVFQSGCDSRRIAASVDPLQFDKFRADPPIINLGCVPVGQALVTYWPLDMLGLPASSVESVYLFQAVPNNWALRFHQMRLVG